MFDINKYNKIMNHIDEYEDKDNKVTSLTDADIFDTPSTVYDQVQFLRCLLLSMTHLKFSGTCNIFVLLQHIPFGSRENPRCRGTDHRHILYNHLPAYPTL